VRKYRSPDCAGVATATLHLSGRWMPFGPRSARCRNVHGHWTLRNLRTGMRATLVLARSRDRTRVSRHGQRPGCSCAPGWKAGFLVTDDGRRRGGDRRGRGPSSPGGSEDAGAHSLPQLNRPGFFRRRFRLSAGRASRSSRRRKQSSSSSTGTSSSVRSTRGNLQAPQDRKRDVCVDRGQVNRLKIHHAPELATAEHETNRYTCVIEREGRFARPAAT
jgi:hypothetical protein